MWVKLLPSLSQTPIIEMCHSTRTRLESEWLESVAYIFPWQTHWNSREDCGQEKDMSLMMTEKDMSLMMTGGDTSNFVVLE